ncbi:MAG TPA: thioredoxin domain-containing protein [Candidatus Saccharimonadales bacterium]|nr:thioredoxin domain-containing protein [Candidatus Saccharimonadales bacterium]
MENLTKDERKALRKEEWQEQLKKAERNKMITKITWIGGGIILVIAAFWAIINFTGSSGSSPQLITNMPPVNAKDLQTGDLKSNVTLTEYADFQCPGCGAYHPIIKKLLQDFKGKIHFVYRTFPLTQVHQNAMISAQNAVAANNQGKFWDMHDMLFEHQADWSTVQNPQGIFDSYAQKLGLDMDRFHKDITDAKTKKFINDEESAGLAIGINSTPTFFINGKQIVSPQTSEAFTQVIQNAFKGN